MCRAGILATPGDDVFAQARGPVPDSVPLLLIKGKGARSGKAHAVLC
jgi:hypothetical protein